MCGSPLRMTWLRIGIAGATPSHDSHSPEGYRPWAAGSRGTCTFSFAGGGQTLPTASSQVCVPTSRGAGAWSLTSLPAPCYQFLPNSQVCSSLHFTNEELSLEFLHFRWRHSPRVNMSLLLGHSSGRSSRFRTSLLPLFPKPCSHTAERVLLVIRTRP